MSFQLLLSVGALFLGCIAATAYAFYSLGRKKERTLSTRAQANAVDNEQKLTELTDQYVALQAEYEKLDAANAELRGEVKMQSEQLSELEGTQKELSALNVDLEAKYSVCSQQLTDANAQLVAVQDQNNELLVQVDDLKAGRNADARIAKGKYEELAANFAVLQVESNEWREKYMAAAKPQSPQAVKPKGRKGRT